MGNTSPPIATHTTFISIGIEIYHFKICGRMIFQQNKTISTDSKPSMANFSDQGSILFWKESRSIVDKNKVIPCTLIFIKSKFHSLTKIYKATSTPDKVGKLNRR